MPLQKAKFTGVSTVAATEDTAVMVTETPTLPRANHVATSEYMPPGQQATRIIPRPSSPGMANAHTANEVSGGRNRNLCDKSCHRCPRDLTNSSEVVEG